MEDPSAAADVFREVGAARIEAIVHPFATDLQRTASWFRHLGPERITHAHVQLRDHAGAAVQLTRQPAFVTQALRLLRDEGFRGSFTIEFTGGVGAGDEKPETLFQYAVQDLQFLREHLA